MINETYVGNIEECYYIDIQYNAIYLFTQFVHHYDFPHSTGHIKYMVYIKAEVIGQK